MTVRYLLGDTREVVASLPDASVDLVLTSPPFLALRSYLPADDPNKHLEIGSDPHPAAFIDTMLGLTAEWRRVLAPHGSIAVEFGDTYSGSGGAGGDYNEKGLRADQPKFSGSALSYRKEAVRNRDLCGWPLAKSLALIPELYRVGLAYGINALTGQPSPAGRWRVRNVVRWVRPNPPVGALGDKFRPATSDLVIACTAGDRWFDLDAVRQPMAESTAERGTGNRRLVGTKSKQSASGHHGRDFDVATGSNPAGAPPLDWWEIVPGGYSGSHYAVYPPELCVRPIEAMCPRRVCRTCGKPSRRETSEPEYVNNAGRPAQFDMSRPRLADGVRQFATNGDNSAHKVTTTTGWSSCGCPGTDGIRLDGFHTGTGWRPGVVLDPFGGSGTTGLVAHGHSRDAILVDLDARNVDLARERLGMFLDVA